MGGLQPCARRVAGLEERKALSRLCVSCSPTPARVLRHALVGGQALRATGPGSFALKMLSPVVGSPDRAASYAKALLLPDPRPWCRCRPTSRHLPRMGLGGRPHHDVFWSGHCRPVRRTSHRHRKTESRPASKYVAWRRIQRDNGLRVGRCRAISPVGSLTEGLPATSSVV